MAVRQQLTCEEAEDAFGALALGALDPEERLQVEEHLSECGRCRRRYAEYDRLSDRLATQAGPVAPSPDLRSRLLREIAAEPRDPQPVDLPTRRRRSLVVPIWVAGLAAVAAVVLIMVTGVLASRLSDTRDQRDAARADTRTIAAYVASGGTLMQLSNVDESPYAGTAYQGRGALLTAPGKDPIVVVSGCTPTRDGLWYHVWLAQDGQRTDLGEMVVGADWSGRFVVQPGQPLTDFDQIGVTIVHGDGAKQDVLIGSAPGLNA